MSFLLLTPDVRSSFLLVVSLVLRCLLTPCGGIDINRWHPVQALLFRKYIVVWDYLSYFKLHEFSTFLNCTWLKVISHCKALTSCGINETQYTWIIKDMEYAWYCQSYLKWEDTFSKVLVLSSLFWSKILVWLVALSKIALGEKTFYNAL